jgi:hypothetical protein
MKVQIELQKLVRRTDIWRDGEYLDLWSVPHFLSGSLLACFIYLLHLDFFYATVLATALLIAYEIFEIKVGITETDWNRRLDVVVGLTSFIPTTILISGWEFKEVLFFGLVVGILDGILSAWGWSAAYKGKVVKKKVLEEYELLKAKFLERMKVIKERREEKKEKKLHEKAEKIAAKLALLQLKKKQKLGHFDVI